MVPMEKDVPSHKIVGSKAINPRWQRYDKLLFTQEQKQDAKFEYGKYNLKIMKMTKQQAIALG